MCIYTNKFIDTYSGWGFLTLYAENDVKKIQLKKQQLKEAKTWQFFASEGPTPKEKGAGTKNCHVFAFLP